MMSIPRGFRRLSILAALVSDAVIVFIWMATSTNPSILQVIAGLVVFASVPAIFILVLGRVGETMSISQGFCRLAA